MRATLTLLLVLSFPVACQAAPPTATPAATPAAAASGPIATVDGQPVDEKALEPMIGPRLAKLRQQEYQLKVEALREYAATKVAEREAKALGITPDEYRRRMVAEKVPAPTKTEIDEVYNRFKARLPQDEAKAREEVTRFLVAQKTQEREQAFSQELLAKARLVIAIEPPRIEIPLEADDPAAGPATAPVTIVEFSDFQCPYCQRAQPTLKRLQGEYGDKVRLVFKQLPLPMHQQARFAAEAALCANEQGRFWAVHDWMFANMNQLNLEALTAKAAEVGFDAAKLSACVNDKRMAPEVEEDLELAHRVGAEGTPAFFVNGRFLEGAQPYEAFKDVIDDELARQK